MHVRLTQQTKTNLSVKQPSPICGASRYHRRAMRLTRNFTRKEEIVPSFGSASAKPYGLGEISRSWIHLMTGDFYEIAVSRGFAGRLVK
jgi:hypothetical protein